MSLLLLGMDWRYLCALADVTTTSRVVCRALVTMPCLLVPSPSIGLAPSMCVTSTRAQRGGKGTQKQGTKLTT